MDTFNLPQELLSAIGSEPTDFICYSKRTQPLKNSLMFLLFALVWLWLSSLFLIPFFTLPIHNIEWIITINKDKPPLWFVTFFFLIGFAFLWYSLYLIFKSGGYFVWTPTRLIHYKKNSIKSIAWWQFTWNIELNWNNESGTLSLELKTGKMIRTKNSGSRYVPDIIYLVGIPEVYEIEKKCRERINKATLSNNN